ncbi:MAG: hypothetical protein LAO03_07725 [Acidobacteriia bacterium]|nr:hypothetical protein [Terriglobia bacterium]
MLHKCANPACSNPFRRLSEGKLFQVETEYLAAPASERNTNGRQNRNPRRVEYYWLCNECASFLTLTFEKDRGMITVPLPDLGLRKTVAAVERADFERVQEPLRVSGLRGEG